MLPAPSLNVSDPALLLQNIPEDKFLPLRQWLVYFYLEILRFFAIGRRSSRLSLSKQAQHESTQRFNGRFRLPSVGDDLSNQRVSNGLGALLVDVTPSNALAERRPAVVEKAET